MSEAIKLVVQDCHQGLRLDSFVAAQLVETSRSTVQRWVEAERITVDGEVRKSSFALTEGQTVVVQPTPPEPLDLIPEDLPLEILFEDDDLLVVNKPAGMVVHPGAGNRQGTLANALLYHLQAISRKESVRPGIVHRLDKGTSGLLLVAKNDFTHDFLARQFQRREVEKIYLALVYGQPKRHEGSVDLPIGRDIRSRVKISPRTARPKPALTEFVVLRQLPGAAYLRVTPHTGRTHQIRVHLHHLGHPIVGDETYPAHPQLFAGVSPAGRKAIRQLDRLALHASRLTFLHPRTKEPLTFEQPLPQELEDLLITLGE